MQKEKINKIRSHAEFISASSMHVVLREQQPWKILNQVQNDGTYFNNNGGFTLIELLVVVLIIGILAAVALPQYNKAVIKARFVQAFINLKTIGDAIKLCELENGASGYTADCNNLENLSITLGEDAAGYAEDFTYRGYNMYGIDKIIATADYIGIPDADVCLCLFRDGSIRGKTDSCVGAPSWDILKAVNIPQATAEDHCDCC